MGKVLIAYNNDSKTNLHKFFESCADETKQICTDNGIVFSSICPPKLKEQNVVGDMPGHQLCFIAAHGDAYGIYNEVEEDIVTTRTTNYNFKGKGFYSVACNCAQHLHPQMKALGLNIFVGYNDTFSVRGDNEPFINSAMAGLRSLLSGDNVKVAKEKMLTAYNEQIAVLEDIDPMAAIELVHNRESLIFDGDDALEFSSL